MIEVLQRTQVRAGELNIRRMSAALALYLLMSFAPLLVVTIGLAGFTIGRGAAQDLILTEIGRLLGPERAEMVARTVDAALEPAASSGAALLGVFALLWSGSRLFFEIERDLDEIWDNPHLTRQAGWRGLWRKLRRRLLSLGILLLMGLLLVTAILLRTLLKLAGESLARYLPGSLGETSLSHDLWLFGLISIALGLIYRLLPAPRPGWRPALLGGLAAGSALSLAILLVGGLLAQVGQNTIIAAALSPLVGLTGLYLAGAIFFIGAILCRELDREQGG